MVAKRRQSHPKATAKPDAPARTTAGHPKAAHKARRCPSEHPKHPRRLKRKKSCPQNAAAPALSGSARKSDFPERKGCPSHINAKKLSGQFSHRQSIPAKRKNAVRKQAQIHQKSGGSIQKEQHKTAKTICGGVILFLYIRRSKNPLNLYIK